MPSGFTGNLVQNASFTQLTLAAPDPNTANDTASDTNVPARADVALTKTGPAQVVPGAHLSYTLTVTNNGPHGATSVSVNNPTPAGATFVSTTGACTTAFPCLLGDLPPGETRTITATYRLPSNYTGPAFISNAATVTNTTIDPGTGNNTRSTLTVVGPPQSDVQIPPTRARAPTS